MKYTGIRSQIGVAKINIRKLLDRQGVDLRSNDLDIAYKELKQQFRAVDTSFDLTNRVTTTSLSKCQVINMDVFIKNKMDAINMIVSSDMQKKGYNFYGRRDELGFYIERRIELVKNTVRDLQYFK